MIEISTKRTRKGLWKSRTRTSNRSFRGLNKKSRRKSRLTTSSTQREEEEALIMCSMLPLRSHRRHRYLGVSNSSIRPMTMGRSKLIPKISITE